MTQLMVDKCCCCIKLTTGGLILGYIQVVYDLIMLTVNTIVLVGYDSLVQAVNATNPEKADMFLKEKDNFILFGVIFMIALFINLVTAILLIRGIMIVS